MRLSGNKWNARKHPSHTCKHVLPGRGWAQTVAAAQATYPAPSRGYPLDDPVGQRDRRLRSNLPRGGNGSTRRNGVDVVGNSLEQVL